MTKHKETVGESVRTFNASDGWKLSGILRVPKDFQSSCAVILVHSSHHERDAFVYGTSIVELLAQKGIASFRFDIRGRGSSLGSQSYHEMAPLDRRKVTLDVKAAINLVINLPGISPNNLFLIGEQDTADSVVQAAVEDLRLKGLILLSPRLSTSSTQQLEVRKIATYILLSKEDRDSLKAATSAYLAAPQSGSRLDLFSGLGFGTTMFMTRSFEQPKETPIQILIRDWILESIISMPDEVTQNQEPTGQ